MKLIKCNKCYDVVRLIAKAWRKCDCGKSGGQYNDDNLSATVGGDCEVIGLRNDFLYKKPFSKGRCDDGKNHIIQGEYKGDVQIWRIKSADGPKLKCIIEKISDTETLITFKDRRKYSINLKGNKMPKSIKMPFSPKGSFIDRTKKK